MAKTKIHIWESVCREAVVEVEHPDGFDPVEFLNCTDNGDYIVQMLDAVNREPEGTELVAEVADDDSPPDLAVDDLHCPECAACDGKGTTGWLVKACRICGGTGRVPFQTA